MPILVKSDEVKSYGRHRPQWVKEDIATLKATIALSQERQAIEMQSKKMLEEVKQHKIEVLKEEERALEEIRKLQGS